MTDAPSPRGPGVGVGDGVAVGVDVGVRVGVGVEVTLGEAGGRVAAPGHGWFAGYCAITMTQATRLPSVLEARAAPTHLNGSDDEGVDTQTPLPG